MPARSTDSGRRMIDDVLSAFRTCASRSEPARPRKHIRIGTAGDTNRAVAERVRRVAEVTPQPPDN